MQRCAQNIPLQTFTERERVNCLIDGIITSDAGLQAAMASIRADAPDNWTGKQDNFEPAAAYIISLSLEWNFASISQVSLGVLQSKKTLQ